MIRSLILVCLTAAAISKASAQIHSVTFTGGIISPLNSSKGLSGQIQFNYKAGSVVEFYFSAGYSTWDKYNLFYKDENPHSLLYIRNTFSEDDHFLIPVYTGARFNFNTVKLFTSFVDLEIGYSYKSFNSYVPKASVNPETGEITGYYPVSKKEVKENLFGIGIGAGLCHPMTEKVNLILACKLNSYINSNYYGLFSTRGTYSTFSAGFNFII